MKRILLLIVFITAALSMRAQVVVVERDSDAAESSSEVREPGDPKYGMMLWNEKQTELLLKENKLLRQRTGALWLTVGGGVLTGLSAAITTLNYDSSTQQVSPGSAALALLSSAAFSAGAIWLLVNEFQLSGTRQQINEHLIIRYSPNGIALEF